MGFQIIALIYAYNLNGAIVAGPIYKTKVGLDDVPHDRGVFVRDVSHYNTAFKEVTGRPRRT